MPWYWWGQTGPWNWWWVFPVAFLLFMVIMTVVMMTFCRHMMMGGCRRPGWQQMDDEALAILRRRFASGEISEEEFIAKRDLLTREHDRPAPTDN